MTPDDPAAARRALWNRAVRLQAQREGLRIDVCDRGPGIPGFALERVFERFYSLPRPDGSARGNGLGLNFVAEIAKLHGGTVHLGNRDGGGAVAMVLLPVA